MSWTDKPAYEPAPPVHMNPWYDSVDVEQRDGRNSTVYLLEAGDAYKVGFTKNAVEARISELQTGSSEKIALVAMRAGGLALEKSIHRRIERYRRHGEWFDRCEAVLTAFHQTEDSVAVEPVQVAVVRELPLFADEKAS